MYLSDGFKACWESSWSCQNYHLEAASARYEFGVIVVVVFGRGGGGQKEEGSVRH